MNYPIEIEPNTLRRLEREALDEGRTVHDLITGLIDARLEQKADETEVENLIRMDVLDSPKVRADIQTRLKRGGIAS